MIIPIAARIPEKTSVSLSLSFFLFNRVTLKRIPEILKTSRKTKSMNMTDVAHFPVPLKAGRLADMPEEVGLEIARRRKIKPRIIHDTSDILLIIFITVSGPILFSFIIFLSVIIFYNNALSI